MDSTLRPVFALSIHADYRCRHSGRCCASDWDVPVELPVYRSLSDALASGRLQMAAQDGPHDPFVLGPDLPEDTAAMFERNERGECVFFARDSRLCVVHRDLGEEALPATCRHFPRLAVRDGRGIFVGLSHYCPTAAAMLFRDDVPVTVVTSPPAFPPADYEGLSVGDDDLPPVLRPGVMMTLDDYARWERHMVRRTAEAHGPETVLATLWRDVELVRTWGPEGPSIAALIDGLPASPVVTDPPAALAESLAAFADVMRAVPDEFRPAADEHDLPAAFERYVRPEWPRWAAPLRRYLSTKAFACWTAYQGQGLRSIVRGMEAALALVRVEAARQCRDAGRPLDEGLLLEAFRQADFILNHLAVGEDLADGWSVVERDGAQSPATGPT